MQPASHNSLTATRLLVMCGTLYAFRAAFGNLSSNNSTVWVVSIVAPFGMPRVLFHSWTCAILHRAFLPTNEIEAAESMNAVVFAKLFGLMQPGVLCCSLSLRLFTTFTTAPAGSPRHFPFGALPNPAFN